MFCFFFSGILLGFLLGKFLYEHEEQLTLYVEVEKHPEGFFAYDSETKKFLGQHTTYEDLISLLTSSFTDHMIYIEEEQVKKS